jgi:hypothetical protein
MDTGRTTFQTIWTIQDPDFLLFQGCSFTPPLGERCWHYPWPPRGSVLHSWTFSTSAAPYPRWCLLSGDQVTKTKQHHVMSPKCNKHISHQIKPSPVLVAQEAQYTFRYHDTSPKLHWITQLRVHLLHKKHPSRKHATTNVISQPPSYYP